jgi:virginiamycin B lyase
MFARSFTRFLAGLTALGMLAGTDACSGASRTGAWLPSASQDSSVRQASDAEPAARSANLTLQISIPKNGTHAAAPRYVSAATESVVVTVALKGKPQATVGIDLTPKTNPNCKSGKSAVTCTQIVPLPPATYTARFTTYSGLLKKGKPSGKALSANQQITFKVPSKGLKVAINNQLAGIPVSVAFAPAAGSQLSGSPKAGYALSRCATAQQVSLTGVDAGGYEILGAGAPTPSLKSSDPAHLAVAGPSRNAPNAFTLTPSTPTAGSTIVLTASVKPLAASGANAVAATIDVRFGSDLCPIFTMYPLPAQTNGLRRIVAGSDGALWFTDASAFEIGRITTAGTVTEYPVPLSVGSLPYGIAAGSDGALWFAAGQNGAGTFSVGRITTAGTMTGYVVSNAYSPREIAAGPDGALWFTEPYAYQGGLNGAIGSITTAGAITTYVLPNTLALQYPSRIAAGPDGALWFTYDFSGYIGRITTGGGISTFGGPQSSQLNQVGIAGGSDGAVWFPDQKETGSTDGIARITSSGAISMLAPNSVPGGTIAAGSDGALWFPAADESGSTTINTIDRLTTGGTLTEYPIPGTQVAATDITQGPDGLWFIAQVGSVDEIGRLQLK